MNYYVLPDVSIFGGIKVGYQFAEMLTSLGAPTVVASPEGRAAQWFRSAVPVVDRESALASATARDNLVFSLPHDYDELARCPARLHFHCQGTDPLIDPILADEEVVVLTGWSQAERYVAERAGREAIDVGISLPDRFHYGGELKRDDRVSFMPRRGRSIAKAAARRNGRLSFAPIDGVPEDAVARSLKESSYFLATSEGEWFGLPALEAMAAGCVVLSVPVLGGTEYLEDGGNALVREAAELPGALEEISAPGMAERRCALRHAAMATALGYREERQRERLAGLLEGPLRRLGGR